MLRELRVGNLTLVDDLSLSFTSGLTILTGETGAGKSLVAGALSLLAGDKAGKDLIRRGEEMAYVEGVFDLDERPGLIGICDVLGIRLAGDAVLVLRRELRREGRGRVLINGLVSSLALLEQVGPRLLGVQSQDQQRLLARPGFARDFLDRSLGLAPLVETVGRLLVAYQDLNRSLLRRRQEEEFARQQLEVWEYQLRELSEASLDAEEETRLGEKIAIGRNSRSLLEKAHHAREALTEGEANARDFLAAAAGALGQVANTSHRLNDILEMLQNAQTATEDAAADLERFLDSVDIDPARLDEWEERHALYGELQRKYQTNVSGLLTMQERLVDRVRRQKEAASDILALEEETEAAARDLADACLRLRQARRAGAPKVAAQAVDLIRPLALPDLDLDFQVDPDSETSGGLEIDGAPCRVTAHGADRVFLLARTNRGESFGEVGRIASGGEKSRIYLGLAVMDQTDEERPLLLFDEIDAGLGMDNAVPVARLLGQLAEGGQVTCITHLPTVAAHGQRHLKVAKWTKGERTRVTVTDLGPEERVEEIARLLGGQLSGDATLAAQEAYARKLLGCAN